jgi:hypothetical protein
VQVDVRPAQEHHPLGRSPVGTVLMLPGRAYPCSASLLAWTTRALQAGGWAVHQAQWQLDRLPDDPRAFVEGVARRLDEVERPAGPVLVVAKSLGTLAAHRAAERGYPAVWLTPVLVAAGRHPLPGASADLAERLSTYPAPNLMVGGTADPLWRSGFRAAGEVVESKGADHALEVGDWRASLRHHERVASSVADFAADVAR